MTVRLDNDVIEMMDALRERFDYKNRSAVLRAAFLRWHPEMTRVVNNLLENKDQRQEILLDIEEHTE